MCMSISIHVIYDTAVHVEKFIETANYRNHVIGKYNYVINAITCNYV